MSSVRHRLGWRTGLVLYLVLMGCATPTFPPLPASEIPEATEPNGWWNIRFKIAWPDTEDPAWHVDLILAHRVIAPVLNAYKEDISLWRFHRRARRDDAGHQFSFAFYASKDTGEKILRSVASSPELTALKKGGVIVREIMEPPLKPSDQRVEASSDSSWSLPIQKSWPHFIMGVSETWLQMIDAFATKKSQQYPPSTVSEHLILYEKVNAAIESAWRDEGGHAFLHHLNAIFGYEGVSIFERRLMTF